jgi:hypothetical protein
MNSAIAATGSRPGSRKNSPSDRRREAARQLKHLFRVLEGAEEALVVAEGTGDANHAEWLRSEIFGRSYVAHAEGLRFEVRAIETAMRDEKVVRRCAEIGISISQLVDWQRRHDRAHGAAADENPARTGSPYRGNRWRSQLGRGGKGAMAR